MAKLAPDGSDSVLSGRRVTAQAQTDLTDLTDVSDNDKIVKVSSLVIPASEHSALFPSWGLLYQYDSARGDLAS